MTTTLAATAFLDTEGVNVTGSTQSYYVSTNLEDVEYLGVSNVRLGITDPSTYGYAAITDATADGGASVQEYADAGIKLDVVDGATDGAVDPDGQLALYNELQAAAPGAIRYVEGLNEINNNPISSFGGYTDDNGPDELSAAESYQSYIDGQITSDPTLAGVGVIGFTGYDTDNFEGDGTNIGGSSEVAAGAADYDVSHVYPAGAPDTYTLAQEFPDLTPSQLAVEAVDGQLVITEEGFYDSTFTTAAETQQADYSLDAFLQNAQEGVATTYLYAVDDGSGYSLFGANGASASTPTPAATAVHNLNAILSAGDTGAVTSPTALEYTINGETPTSGVDGMGLSSMELTETNGASDVILWNDMSVGALNELVQFGTNVNVSVYDPVTGTMAAQTYTDVGAVDVTVGADPEILEVTPVAAASTTVSAGTGPDTVDVTVVNTSASTQTFNFLISPTNDGDWDQNLGSVYSDSLAAGASETIKVSGSFDESGTEPTVLLYNYTPGALDVTGVVNDGFVSPGVALDASSGASQLVAFGQPTTGSTDINYGSGPDEISVSVSGLTNVTQYEVEVGEPGTGAAIDPGKEETSAQGSYDQTINIFGTFSGPQMVAVGDYQGSEYGNDFTGGTSQLDPNAGIVVNSIDYDGNVVYPNETITAQDLGQAFTVEPETTIPMTQYAAPATSGPLDASLVVDNASDLGTQLNGFLSAYEAGDAKILFMGDSTTAGVGSNPSNSEDTAGSYPDEFAYSLNQDGIGAQIASVEGVNNNGGAEQLSFSGGASINSAYSITGPTPLLSGAGSSITFTPDDPISANQVEAQVYGGGGSPIDVSVNGTFAGTITPSSDGLFDNDTLTLANAETITSVTFTETGTGGQYLEGVETNNTASNAIKVLNAGVSGGTADGTNYQETVGDFPAGANWTMPNVIAQDPNLVFIDYGINDMNYGETIPTFISAVGSIVSDLQAANINVVLMSPTPWSDSQGQTNEASMVSALGSLAVADGIPFLDLNATYGGSSTDNIDSLGAAGFYSTSPGNPHPSATAYANIGQQIGSFVASAIHTYA